MRGQQRRRDQSRKPEEDSFQTKQSRLRGQCLRQAGSSLLGMIGRAERNEILRKRYNGRNGKMVTRRRRQLRVLMAALAIGLGFLCANKASAQVTVLTEPGTFAGRVEIIA